MKFAFCIFKFFPYGGLQRDFLRIMQTCVSHGHEVDVYTLRWKGEVSEGINLFILPSIGLTNHTRAKYFSKKFQSAIKHKSYNLIIGFNKMAGLDVYFAGDVCLKERVSKEKKILSRFLLRYRVFLKQEKEVFSPESTTEILLLTEKQKNEYIKNYGTPVERFHIIPPGIAENNYTNEEMVKIRADIRDSLGISQNKILLLFVASSFHSKGLGRALRAMIAANDQRLKLIVIGDGDNKPYRSVAKKLGFSKQVCFLGSKEALLPYMLSADILIHPARVEAAGMVLVEALTAGLPVITTDICGYAIHIEKAQSGVILPSPFKQEVLNQALVNMINSENLNRYRASALAYSKQTDLYHMTDKAVELLEQFGNRKLK